MPTRGVSKWAIGEPMIEWCERNGLDARRIPDQNDAITISDDLAQPYVALVADVVYIFGPDDDHVPHYPDAVAKFGDGYDRVEIVRRVPVDSEPPLNPEWVALFGKGRVAVNRHAMSDS